eukprot:CAMPEP_0194763530 /NCGR_PEP_ID=MMETSP0323_2-20130528/19696_1 /TAXON_ID=2866 ORGANISM="Crypthecodinium cohnii, Strain Seligo" /NCGR_SAMPLE_ID=MMETSP0323_2 /ASSEMBLY_ACC=CAM_ASM_000346 /LENGTH=74 /DNA_ID=CAMNT_0039688519 /DNA_START=34 /DNA_END=258 /DNA_ORIENTATION=+
MTAGSQRALSIALDCCSKAGKFAQEAEKGSSTVSLPPRHRQGRGKTKSERQKDGGVRALRFKVRTTELLSGSGC